MRPATGTIAGLALGVMIAACAVHGAQRVEPYDPRKNEIANLDTQIRQWRVEAGLSADVPRQLSAFFSNKSVRQAEAVCPDSHVPPKECNEICDLADAICDNAESICGIAADLRDDWSKGKCDGAKASCKQAQERCCACDNSKRAAAVYEMAEELP